MQKTLINISLLGGIHNLGKNVLRGAELSLWEQLDHAWLSIENDTIMDFGRMVDWKPEADHLIEDMRGAAIIPAFIDSHTHLVFANSREAEFEDRLNGLSYQEIAERGGGILNSVKALRSLSEDELFKRSEERLKKLMAFGTAGIEIKSGYGLDLESELKMLKVIRRLKESFPIPVKATLLAAHAIPTEFKIHPDSYVDLVVQEMIPEVGRQGLADYIDVFCESGYFSPDQTDKILEAGMNYGLKSRVHVNQFTISGGVEVCLKHRSISVDHLEVVNEEEIAALATSQTMVTALPGCSFFLGIPYTPLRKMIDAGIAVNLASDYNPGSSPGGNLKFILSLACIQQKLSVTEAINALTLNAAAALEISDNYGSITKGKKANVLALKPMPSLAYLAYAYDEALIDRVMINGNWV